jgi:Secretion system C-terminal sorting domain
LATFSSLGFTTNPGRYTTFSHPLGDIKKKSIPGQVITITGSTVGLVCRVVTKIIDGIFRLFGGNKKTEAACRFLEFQTAWVPIFSFGGVEDGSSGSSLISYDDKIIGTLSNTIPSVACGFQNAHYNKFRVAYYRDEVRTTLNPSNNFWLDQYGMESNITTCFSSLNNLSGEYFAGKDYATNSGIVSNGRTFLRSASTISTSGTVRIHPGADYVFVCPSGTVLNAGFEIVPPATAIGETAGVFEIQKGSCVVPRSNENSVDIPYEMLNRAWNLKLPEYKPFNLTTDNNNFPDVNSIQVFPNPNEGNFTIRFETKTESRVELNFTDILGRSIFSTSLKTNQGDNFYELNLNDKKLQAGVYFLTLVEGESKRVQKVMTQ